jgi:hypothetical protein
MGVGYVAGAGGSTIDSIRTHLLNGLMQTGGTALPASKSIYDETGGFLAYVNIAGGLKGVLGIPDVLNKSLYTCLITDRLDNGTYGLSALKTLIDADMLKLPGKSPDVQVDVTLPDVASTTRDLFDGGAGTDNQTPASFYASWDTDAQVNVHVIVDLVNMAGGDTITITFYKFVKTAVRQWMTYTFTGVQTNPIQEFTLYATTSAYIQGTIAQSAGTARVVPTSHYADLGKNKRV